MHVRYLLFLFKILVGPAVAQSVYFHQDFQKTTSLVNPQPDSGQFSHIILTFPQLSYHKFHKGYMELIRTQQDSAKGGIIRALRTTPFSPNPKALFIQITLSAESIQSNAVNALYFYTGENFDPVNNSIPGNGLMFGRFAINFANQTMVIKDSETQQLSEAIPVKKQVTLTWVLNNSNAAISYAINAQTPESQVNSGQYDLWVNDRAVSLGSKAYPGESTFSLTKLSNFEIRYRNGLGKIRIHEILIREAGMQNEDRAFFAMPNPVSGEAFIVNLPENQARSIRVHHISGIEIPVSFNMISKKKAEVRLPAGLAGGIYLVSYLDENGRRQSYRLMIKSK